MEVSQIAALDTHAIIGGERPEAFTMSESAEFFTVLSDTLYRDKKRAAVREILCNAWDAHIMVGKTDLPIEVTITDTEMVIRDFGPGIPHVKIGPTYCRYGGTTKIADERQTGGFGLGSKAPFAYADHFSVTSCIDGEKSVYAISRGGAETQGKPDFRRMVRVPTEETGITVSIPLRDPDDKKIFVGLAREIVTLGGMKAQINEKACEGLDYTIARKTGYCLIDAAAIDCGYALNEGAVYVLYGTVVYPLTSADRDILEATRRLPITHLPHSSRVILVAAPGSIGVTPSRESLSYTDKTKAALLALLTRATRQMKHFAKVSTNALAHRAIADFARALEGEKFWWQCGSTVFDRNFRITHAKIRDTPEEIGYFIAYHGKGDYASNGARTVTRELAKRDRHHRRFLRRLSYDPKRNAREHHLSYYERAKYVPSRKEIFQRETRLFIRLASKLGLLKQLYVVHVTGRRDNDCAMVARPTRYTEYLKRNMDIALEFPAQLTIGMVQRDVVDAVYRAVGKPSSRSEEPNAYFALMLKRNQSALIPEINRLARKFKFKAVTAEVTKPPKREAPLAKTYRSLAGVSEYGEVSEEHKIDSAPIYMLPKTRRPTLGVSDAVKKNRALLLQLFPTVAIASNDREEAKLKASGAIPFVDALIAKVNEIWQHREVKLAFCVAHHPITGARYDKPSYVLSDMSRRDIDLFLAMAHDRTRLSDVGRLAFLLFKFLADYRDTCAKEAQTKLDDLFAELNKVSRRAFPKYPLNSKQVDEQLSYLRPILNHWSYSLSNLPDDLIGDLFAALRRRADKQPKTNQNTNLEEAA